MKSALTSKPIRAERDYILHELTRSTCPQCLQMIDAKIVITKSGQVKMLKTCPQHGAFEVLLSTNPDYYCNSSLYNKAGSIPLQFSTEVKAGCPHDCGLCPEHEQHTCVALMEITDRCNMRCPICYANSGVGEDLSLEQVQKMLDCYIAAEGNPEVLQVSGGEPTLHPQLPDILRLAAASGLKAVLINTNGLRIAQDEAFVASLQEFGDQLEIYLQFDSLTAQVGEIIRGQDLSQIRRQALANLEKYGILTNLVVTLLKGVNEHEIGPVLEEAIQRSNVTGVVFQLLTQVGRAGQIERNQLTRLTVPDVLGQIAQQTAGTFQESDFIPLPCPHPNCTSLTYAMVTGDRKKQVKPLPRYLDVRKYLDYFRNTLCIDARELLNEAIYHSLDRMWSASASLRLVEVLKDFSRCCGVKFKPNGDSDPFKQMPGKPLRIVIKPFMDAYDYDLKRAKKCCIHVLTPDGQLVPFCNYNIFRRRR